MTSQHMDVQDILEKKLKACDDFLSTTLLLKKSLESHDIVTVVGSIKRRNDLIRLVDALDHKLGTSRGSILTDKKSDIACSVNKILSDINGILKSIVEINNDCSTMAMRGYESLAMQMAHYRREKEGLDGYAQQAPRPPKFLNLQT